MVNVKLKDLAFNDKNDKLKREKHALQLTNFLLKNEEINVISINSKWGTGKTWFVWQWINKIKKTPEFQEKIIPIYYNAWINDDYSDAFTPLLSEIDSELFDKDEKSEKITKFKNASKTVLKSGLINLISNLTKGLIDLQKFIDSWNENDLYKETIDEFKTLKEARTNFVNTLKEILIEKNKKVFIFIDELDRCRPTFALETLERIKHYFDIDGIHFILLIDREQLSYSAKVLYGTECDTIGYLRRFIDIEYSLIEPKGSSYFLKILPDNMRSEFTKCISNLSVFFKLSLRDYDKLILWIKALLSNPSADIIHLSRDLYYFYAYLLLMKMKYPNIVESLDSSDGLKNLKSYQEMPLSEEIDGFTKSDSGVRVTRMTYCILSENSGLIVLFPETMSNREEDWCKSHEIKDIILNGIKEMKFLDRYNL